MTWLLHSLLVSLANLFIDRCNEIQLKQWNPFWMNKHGNLWCRSNKYRFPWVFLGLSRPLPQDDTHKSRSVPGQRWQSNSCILIYIFIYTYETWTFCWWRHAQFDIYLHICMCICIHIYKYMYICIYVYMYIWVDIHRYIHVIINVTVGARRPCSCKGLRVASPHMNYHI